MGEVTRYEPACEEEDGFEGCSPYMEEYADGDYIKFADHDAALRRAKAEVWREAESEARREAGNPGNTGDYQLACRYLAEVYSARAAQIEEGE